MSQIPMTSDERTAAVRRFGYTEREAVFLGMAALHGGYFVLRQYCQFLGKEIGGTAAALARKTLALGHAKVSTYCKRVNVYHLCTRPFYATLGQADNRNRRLRQPLTIKNRLMGFDFALAHRDYRFLTTEEEKVGYFTGVGVGLSALPTRRYRGAKTGAATDRYFVDKYPICLAAPSASGSTPVVAFCFVDEGATTVAAFETYLRQYGPLLAALPAFHIVYVAATPVHFSWAQKVFEQFWTTLQEGSNGKPLDPEIRRRLDHFEARSLYENGQFASFDRAKLIRLRDERQEFSSPDDQALYERWKEGGARSVLGILAPESRSLKRSINGQFSTYLLEHPYDLFGSLAAS